MLCVVRWFVSGQGVVSIIYMLYYPERQVRKVYPIDVPVF